ncbi:MAG: hypothetical protein RBT76_15585, partial [candidate division Zixibacteria bacterium]|nr:hypothetical protein [candidate division Zixibacteria bacterium]
MKESRTEWKLRKAGCGLIVYLIYLFIASNILSEYGPQEGTAKTIMYTIVLLGPLVLHFILWVVRTLMAMPDPKDTKVLIEHLNKVAPIPEFEAGLSEEDYQARRREALLRRIRAAFAFEERKKGKPLTVSEKNYIEIALNIREEEYLQDEWELAALRRQKEVSPEAVEEEVSLSTIEGELREQFGKRGELFTPRDKRELAGMTPEGRLRRYNDITKLLHGGAADPEKPADEASSKPPTKEEIDEADVDEEVMRTFKEESKFDEYAELQRAKIIVLYEHEPEKRNKRLRIFNNMVLRYR